MKPGSYHETIVIETDGSRAEVTVNVEVDDPPHRTSTPSHSKPIGSSASVPAINWGKLPIKELYVAGAIAIGFIVWYLPVLQSGSAVRGAAQSFCGFSIFAILFFFLVVRKLAK
jgi:hypothetical protein